MILRQLYKFEILRIIFSRFDSFVNWIVIAITDNTDITKTCLTLFVFHSHPQIYKTFELPRLFLLAKYIWPKTLYPFSEWNDNNFARLNKHSSAWFCLQFDFLFNKVKPTPLGSVNLVPLNLNYICMQITKRWIFITKVGFCRGIRNRKKVASKSMHVSGTHAIRRK